MLTYGFVADSFVFVVNCSVANQRMDSCRQTQ